MIFENVIIEGVTSLKFLGVHFQNLEWTTNTNKIKNDIPRSIGQLFSLNDVLPSSLNKNIIL